MFYLNLNKYKNFRIILTNKYLLINNINGFIKLKTNFFNLFIYKNKIYFNFINYLKLNTNFLLNYYTNYIFNILNNIYYLKYFNNIYLNIKGIGYKFILENKKLIIRIGYSHYIIYYLKNYIYYYIKNNTCIILYSNNKYNLIKIATFIKNYKKINLYKKNGIFYKNELLIFKKKEKKNI